MIGRLKEYLFGFFILIRVLIGLAVMSVIVQVPHQYQRFFVYRHRCQLRKSLSMDDYISFYRDMVAWCADNNIEYITTFARDNEFNFKNSSDAVAFKLMWAEWVR